MKKTFRTHIHAPLPPLKYWTETTKAVPKK